MKVSNAFFAMAGACAVFAGSSNLFAQTSATASQTYSVTVNPSVSITSPANATLTYDGTSNNQAFSAQSWNVRGNDLSGITVTFVAGSPFTNTTNGNYMRDVQLGLATGTTTGSATWSITKASGQTNYSSSVNTASVAAASNGVGSANMLLSVTFLTGDPTTLAAGTYTTTVTGTVTAN